jgi:hypothetical protein
MKRSKKFLLYGFVAACIGYAIYKWRNLFGDDEFWG